MSQIFTDSQGDAQTVEITSYDKETIEMEHKAKEVAMRLTQAYPRHPWAVGWAPGMTLIVKLLSSPNSNFGYTIDCAASFSASDLAKSAVMAGGELLERLNMPRGAWNGDMPSQNYDGVAVENQVPIFDGASSVGFSL